MTGTFFGDFDVEDALDTEPADPMQVARKLHGYRVLLERLVGRELDDYNDLPRREVDDLLAVGERIVEYAADNDPDDEGLARFIVVDWDELPADHKRLAVAIVGLIIGWMIRQGSWR